MEIPCPRCGEANLESTNSPEDGPDWRCPKCGALLFNVLAGEGDIVGLRAEFGKSLIEAH